MLESLRGFEMSASADVGGEGLDSFARRRPSSTQCDFYGAGVTHQNTFTGNSLKHLFHVYCHFGRGMMPQS